MSNLLRDAADVRVGSGLPDGCGAPASQTPRAHQFSILLTRPRLHELIAAQHHVTKQVRADRPSVQTALDRVHTPRHGTDAADRKTDILELAAGWIHADHCRQAHHGNHQRPPVTDLLEGAAVALERVAFNAEQDFVMLALGLSGPLDEIDQAHAATPHHAITQPGNFDRCVGPHQRRPSLPPLVYLISYSP